MIISRTPYRISFLGGGTDYPQWYREHGGAVLSTTINRYCYITCRYLPPFFAHKHRIVYSIIEDAMTIDEIRHPAVRECLRFMKIEEGMEIHHDGDLPKQSGLGTSSSFTVGLLNALHALRGETTTPLQLAQEAIHVERDLCGDRVGSQDQVATSFGGFNRIRFLQNDEFEIDPISMSGERFRLFQQHFMLFFTGFSRIASDIAKEQLANIPEKKPELRAMHDMVEEGVRILTGHGNLDAFGHLLNEGWRLKKTLSGKISTGAIDAMYHEARKAGALGGKITGAGGGGFLLLFVPPTHQAAVRKALPSYMNVPFSFESSGSQLILCQPTEAEFRITDGA